jgi:hypothetical protein
MALFTASRSGEWGCSRDAKETKEACPLPADVARPGVGPRGGLWSERWRWRRLGWAWPSRTMDVTRGLALLPCQWRRLAVCLGSRGGGERKDGEQPLATPATSLAGTSPATTRHPTHPAHPTSRALGSSPCSQPHRADVICSCAACTVPIDNCTRPRTASPSLRTPVTLRTREGGCMHPCCPPAMPTCVRVRALIDF